MANKTLTGARNAKNDEFYTQLSDIEREVEHYEKHFNGKTIFCNCDDPEYSNFYYYFVSNFERLGLKKLITTHFETGARSFAIVYEGGADVHGDKQTIINRSIKIAKRKALKQNFEQGSGSSLFDDEPERSYSGDFRSPECIELLQQSDIVVTNPPFSLFREYVAQLIEYDKKFLIIGNTNAITYKECFNLIKESKMWMGYRAATGGMWFEVSANAEKWDKIINTKKMRNTKANWYTNLDHKKRHEELILWANYTPEKYPKYDNYDAIEVGKTVEIPQDYDGVMGVPITFLDKYNPAQFEILGNSNVRGEREHLMTNHNSPTDCTYINGKAQFARILIKRRIK